jgi:hypothetical protein
MEQMKYVSIEGMPNKRAIGWVNHIKTGSWKNLIFKEMI